MGKKIAGKLNQPPAQVDFNGLPLSVLCGHVTGIFYRLHSSDPATGNAWPPLHFSKKGNSRFDSTGGVGALCIGDTLAGAMMEVFDDHWGPVGSPGRSVTDMQLHGTWVTRISLPIVNLLDATGPNLSKIGTDAQLLTGKYTTTRKWAARMMAHPDQIDGVLYRSRHDLSRVNVALFQRASFLPPLLDPDLQPAEPDTWTRNAGHGAALVHGNALRLRDHPGLMASLVELQIARLP
jgi:hypothetical protein